VRAHSLPFCRTARARTGHAPPATRPAHTSVPQDGRHPQPHRTRLRRAHTPVPQDGHPLTAAPHPPPPRADFRSSGRPSAHGGAAPAFSPRTLPFLRTAKAARPHPRPLHAHASVPQDGRRPVLQNGNEIGDPSLSKRRGHGRAPLSVSALPSASRANFRCAGRPTARPAERKRNRRRTMAPLRSAPERSAQMRSRVPVSARARPAPFGRPTYPRPAQASVVQDANAPSCRTETKWAAHHDPNEVSPSAVSRGPAPPRAAAARAARPRRPEPEPAPTAPSSRRARAPGRPARHRARRRRS